MRSKTIAFDVRQHRVEIAFDADAAVGIAGGQKRLRADEDDARSEPPETANRRMRDAAMKNVADDRDRAPGKIAELFNQGVDVEQRLRRMGVRSVAGIDHVPVEAQRDLPGEAGLRMAHDDDGDPHRAKRHRHIFERLAFACQARIARNEVHDVGPQPQFGEVERGKRAGALLKKHVDASFTGEPRPGRRLFELRRAVENVREFFSGQIVEIEEATAYPHRWFPGYRFRPCQRAAARERPSRADCATSP